MRRLRASGDYDVAAKEAQRKAAAYGRAGERMGSAIYAGRDFSELRSAEVVSKSANPVIVWALQVPGRAGAMPVAGCLPPADVAVRLSPT